MRWPDANILNAPTGESGLQMAKSEDPDIVILDIGLPDIDGFEVCSNIRGFSDVPIVMLTVRDDRNDVIKGLELGDDDYILKPFKPEELLARINAILRRIQMTHLSDVEMIFRQGDLIINFRHGEVHANSERIRLAPTEYQIFYHLITNAGRVVASQALWTISGARSTVRSPSF
jgi:DNA-binding response OmpR family regulator